MFSNEMTITVTSALLTIAFVLFGYVLFYRLPIIKTSFIDLAIKVPVLLIAALIARHAFL